MAAGDPRESNREGRWYDELKFWRAFERKDYWIIVLAIFMPVIFMPIFVEYLGPLILVGGEYPPGFPKWSMGLGTLVTSYLVIFGAIISGLLQRHGRDIERRRDE